jgi:hypothetical protein
VTAAPRRSECQDSAIPGAQALAVGGVTPTAPKRCAPAPTGSIRRAVTAQPSAGPQRASLLDLDPELAPLLRSAGAEAVGRSPLLPVLSLPPGRVDASAWTLPPGTVALVVLEGLLLREPLARDGAALSGPGDLVEPWSLRPGLRWTACAPLRVAVIGRPALFALQPWPEALARLLSRALSQESRQLEALAIARRRDADDRLLGRLGQLAARWGRRTAAGTEIALPISPELLGRLAGVPAGATTGLVKRLHQRGLASQRRDGTWLLRRNIAPGGRSLSDPDKAREAMIAAFANAAETHLAAVMTSHALAGRSGAGSRLQRAPADAQSE